ncbi:MAG: siphovirus Gp157 family protein [Bacteroidales bacterium]|nr:siphovirus Gp157 family protein [Bacteroidales bacterium]
MSTLYDEVNMIEDAINGILYGEGDIDIDALNNLLDVKQETIKRGLESLCKIRARKNLTLAAIKAEIARLTDRANTETRALDRLEQYIHDVLRRSGEKKVEAGTFVVSTRTSSSVWVSPTFDNPEFMRTNTTTSPDKTAIKEAIKAGRTIDGAYIVTKENIQIK